MRLDVSTWLDADTIISVDRNGWLQMEDGCGSELTLFARTNRGDIDESIEKVREMANACSRLREALIVMKAEFEADVHS